MESPSPLFGPDGSIGESSALASALDALVDVAAQGDVAALERLLLRSLVALGLTDAAGLWYRDEGADPWRRVRSFGGETSPPAEGCVTPRTEHYELAEGRFVVALRDPFDVDGSREEREETIEALVNLAAMLVDATGGPWDSTPGALPEAG